MPANTRSPGATRCGTVSPVIRLVSSSPAPAVTRAVDADPLAGRDQDLLPGLELLRPDAAGGRRPAAPGVTAAAFSASSRSAAERALPARALVEIAADQQEEQQRDGAVEIGVLGRRGWSRPGSSPGARITASEIGTSMLVRPARSARQAERKNGRPA